MIELLQISRAQKSKCLSSCEQEVLLCHRVSFGENKPAVAQMLRWASKQDVFQRVSERGWCVQALQPGARRSFPQSSRSS